MKEVDRKKFSDMQKAKKFDYQWLFDIALKEKERIKAKYGDKDRYKLLYVFMECLGAIIWLGNSPDRRPDQNRANGTPEDYYIRGLAHYLHLADFVENTDYTWTQKELKDKEGAK
jgi:hypothetical protein